MIERVRSLAMVSFLVVKCLGKRRPDNSLPGGLAKWSLAYIQLAAPPQRPGQTPEKACFRAC
jgi:hypothetical protein